MKIQELAKLAGVSPATVSRAFNHHPNIRDDVRQRILDLAEQHAYRPRTTRKPRRAVVVLPDHELHPIRNCLEMVMSALVKELPRRGFRIEVLPQSNLERLGRLPCSGVIAVGADPADFAAWAERFPCPLVLVDRTAAAPARQVHAVRSDEDQGMALAISHLQARGCRSIGCIVHGVAGHGNADVRRAAIRRALLRHGLPCDDALIRISRDDGYLAVIDDLLRLDVDALFCPGGNAGIITAFALARAGRRIPDDISLMASENMQFSHLATPPQTTIAQDHLGLANLAADIIDGYQDGVIPPAEHTLPYRLIIRSSVRER